MAILPSQMPQPYDDGTTAFLKVVKAAVRAGGGGLKVRANQARPSQGFDQGGTIRQQPRVAMNAGTGISITGTGTDNHLMRWDGTSAAQDSRVIETDAGVQTSSHSSSPTQLIYGMTPGTNIAVSETGDYIEGTDTYLIATLGATPRYDVSSTGVGFTGSYRPNKIIYKDLGTSRTMAFELSTLGGSRVITFPDASGTVALTSDIPTAQPPDVISITSGDFGPDYTIADTVGFVYFDASALSGGELLYVPDAATYGRHRLLIFVTSGAVDATLTPQGSDAVQGAALNIGATTGDTALLFSDGAGVWTRIN